MKLENCNSQGSLPVGTEATRHDGVGCPVQSHPIIFGTLGWDRKLAEATGVDGVGWPGTSHPIPGGTVGWDKKLGLRPLGRIAWDTPGSPTPFQMRYWDGMEICH